MDKEKRQFFRFCLYGFLKNLQFFEPFLILAFRDTGLSFSQIGILIGFRAACVNIMEIPSGAVADVLGRRRAMMASMLGYIGSFVLFASVDLFWMYFPAMFMFSIGEAFRTGTHKAMILNWLEHNNRQNEKSLIYGMTRAWSKQGSSINCVIAAVIFISTKEYRWIFLLSAVPYLLNIINFMFYPAYLDGAEGKAKGLSEIVSTLKFGVRLCVKRGNLRDLILENICFEGAYAVVKDFLQPTIRSAALALPLFLAYSGETRTAVIIALVYMVLNQGSSLASSQSHRLVKISGGESALSRYLWVVGIGLYVVMGLAFVFELSATAISGFVILALLFNIWKPVLVSRLYDESEQETAATVLSVANQGKSLSVVVLAPLLGWAVDAVSGGGTEDAGAICLSSLWPVALVGLAASLVGLAINSVLTRKIQEDDRTD